MDIQKNNLENLTKMVKNNNADAMEKLYKEFYSDVYFICMKILGNPHDAEDITQETFIDAFGNIQSLKEPANFGSWIGRIAANKSINFLKRQSRIVLQDNDQLDNLVDITDFEVSFEDRVIDKDIAVTLGNIIQSLPDEQRNTLLLFYYQKLSIKEIAELYDCPQSTVTSRLIYARKAAKKKIEELEDNGYRLRCINALPFMYALFKTQKSTFSVIAPDGIAAAAKGADYIVGSEKAAEGMKVIALSAKVKIAVAGIAAAAVVGGGVLIGTAQNRNNNAVSEESVVSSAESRINMETSAPESSITIEESIVSEPTSELSDANETEISNTPQTSEKEPETSTEEIILTEYEETFTTQDTLLFEHNGQLLYNTGSTGILNISGEIPETIKTTYENPMEDFVMELASYHTFFLGDEIYIIKSTPFDRVFQIDMSDLNNVTTKIMFGLNGYKINENFAFFRCLIKPSKVQAEGDYFYFYAEPDDFSRSMYTKFKDDSDEAEQKREKSYFRLAKVKKDGTESEVLDNIITDGFAIKDGYIYYYDNGYYSDKIKDNIVLAKPIYDLSRAGIYKIKADGSGEKTLLHALPDKAMDGSNRAVYNLAIYDDYIYYIDISESGKGMIYRIKTDGSGYQAVSSSCGYNYTVNGNTLYYTDAERYTEPTEAAYHFIQADLSSGKEQTLFSFNKKAVDLKFQRYQDYIYFCDNDAKYASYSEGYIDITEMGTVDFNASYDGIGTCGNRYDLKDKTMERIAAYSVGETYYFWRTIELNEDNIYPILDDNFSLFYR